MEMMFIASHSNYLLSHLYAAVAAICHDPSLVLDPHCVLFPKSLKKNMRSSPTTNRIMIIVIIEWSERGAEEKAGDSSKLEYICHFSFGIVINFILHFDG